MTVTKAKNLASYLELLQNNPAESKTLRDDLLIHAAEFFSDPKAFDVLKKKVFPGLLRESSPDDTIRIWSAGCSTGEEAYSLAIVFSDFLEQEKAHRRIQIFGTDISRSAIARARNGQYSKSAIKKIPRYYLDRFFEKSENGYCVVKKIRELCVFACQDIGKDPPFAHLDLISCRNVLIHLGRELQERAFPIFYYALKPNGCLWLGSLDTTGASSLFKVLDRTHKFYVKSPSAARIDLGFGRGESYFHANGI